MSISQHAFALPVDGGECFCIYRAPSIGSVAGTVVHLPAFGDEMNKSRAMTARAARAFANAGYAVLQMDLYGCGDSAGEHGDATLSRWTDNALCAVEWMRRQNGPEARRWLWSLRAGALLITRLLPLACGETSLLLWQPTLSGAQQLNHLLRQKLAAELGDSASERTGAKALRARLDAGETLEIGGYAISSRLARELDETGFELPPGYRGRIEWFEVTAGGVGLSPAARSKIDALRASGIDVHGAAIDGPGFWQATEIERCDALIDASLASLATDYTDGISRNAALV